MRKFENFKMRAVAIILFLVLVRTPAMAQDTTFLKNILFQSTNEKLTNPLKDAEKHNIQIIYTQINRDKYNHPRLTTYPFHLNDTNYFYPASMVKLPTCAMILEKFNDLHIPNLNKETHCCIDSDYACQSCVKIDTQSSTGFPSMGNYIKKMLLVSDNDAYNRGYQFIGQEQLNSRLWQMGYPSARIIQQFNGCRIEGNKHTPPFRFFGEDSSLIYYQPGQFNITKYEPPFGKVGLGKTYMYGTKKIEEPWDCTNCNTLSLSVVDSLVKSIIFPQLMPEHRRFRLCIDDYDFLRKYMSTYPVEGDVMVYHDTNFYDAYKKYLYYGRRKDSVMNPDIRIFNIVGQSFGFLADCAYIVDYKNKLEFFLSAVIYANDDECINDSKYDYETVGFPFLGALGREIYAYELHRKRTYKPNLDEFKLHGE